MGEQSPLEGDLAWDWMAAALMKAYPGLTFEYVESLPYDRLQVLIGIENGIAKYKQMHQK